MDLFEISNLGKAMFISQRHVDDPVVRQGRHGVENSHLLASSGGSSGHKDACVFSMQSSCLPQTHSSVPVGFPLGRKVAKSGRNAKQKRVVLLESGRGRNGIRGLRRSSHFGENFVGESFGHLEEIRLASSGDNGLLHGNGEFSDVSVDGVVDDSDFGRCHGVYALWLVCVLVGVFV